MEVFEQKKFKKILNRNLILPIVFGFLSAIIFILIIFYLLSVARGVDKSDVIISTANDMLKQMVDQETGMRGFIITRNDTYLQPYQQGRALLPGTLSKLHDFFEKNTGQQQRLSTISEAYNQWYDYAEHAIALRGKSTDAIDAIDAVSQSGKQLMDGIRTQGEEMVAEELAVKAQRNKSASMLAIVLAVGFFALNLLFSGILAQIGRRQIINLVSSYEKLLRNLDKQNLALQDEEWLQAGELGMAEQVIGQLPLPILCQNVLAYLAERIGILVGALYVKHSEEYFQREANYGFSKDNTQQEQRFELREGLVGQAAAENRIINLSEVPIDYLKVSSGLGDAGPSHILLVPIHAEAATVAVLELGFFRTIEARDLVFLKRVAENIGAAIIGATYRRRLHDTLLDMQQLNDELQAQQEELRAANEELEEQSQALEESQQRLEIQHIDLEQANYALQDNNEALRSARTLLEERASQVEQASRYKSEFLANMSHELRTPLNSALILSKLLADNTQKNLTEEQVRFATAIHSAGEDLLALINDILDLSKVEAGKIAISLDEMPIANLIDMQRTYFEALATEKDLDFSVSIADDVPEKIRTDRQRLEQILRNLLSNAFKFTAHGTVRLSVTKSASDTVEFAVSDSGIGIGEKEQALIFEPFRQIDAANNRKYGGAGLGLSISKDLARLLGGMLKVHSAPGKGSTFTLTLPIEFRETSFETAASPTALFIQQRISGQYGIENDALEQNERLMAQVKIRIPVRDFDDDRETVNDRERIILVVEDEINFAHILYDLAHELKYSCLVATSAEEAFDLAKEFHPCAILLDMKLPDHSGLSVLARLKKEPITRHIPVHVISVEERSAIALRMGAVGYVLKPVTHDQLRELFSEIESSLTNTMKQVLIVEDFSQQIAYADSQADPIGNSHLVSTARLVSDVDVNATTVATGGQALELLKQRVFDCMITDFDLPDMSAIQLLSRMTEAEIYSFPPVIVHSSRNLTHAEEEALLRHSQSIIIKGVRSTERLLDEVTLFLHRVEADLSDEKKHALRRFRDSDRIFENRTILIVDDDVRNIFALTSVLEGKGANVAIGRNGFDAINKLNDNSEIDLVLMDIMMPEMDGYEAMEKIRQDRRFVKLPIIAITAKAMRDDQERCLRAGASDYVAKPVNLDRLISLIRVWLPPVQLI